jgi:type I restriction enzyme S subunit
MERPGGVGMVEAQRLPQGAQQPDIPKRHLTTTVSLREVSQTGLRLEASAFGIEARDAVAALRASGWPLMKLFGADGLSNEAHNAFRFRRIFVDAEHGIPFLPSAEIISLYPTTTRFLSRKLSKNLDHLMIQKWDVLISCSGTIGNVTLAGERLTKYALSQDAIRIRFKDQDTAAFIAAFLRSRYGRLQLLRTTYGSVIVHIEPEHLERVLVPNLHPLRRVAIGRLFVEACNLRDEANTLLDTADSSLHNHLGLPPLRECEEEPLSTRIKSSHLAGRFEASYHSPLAKEAYAYIQQLSCDVLSLGDPKVTTEVRPITKFRKRVYVDEGGIPLLSSKQLFQIDPVDVKGLAKGAHLKDMPEIELKENMLAVTCSGTIGRVQIIPRYMEGWAANQHATRVIASDDMNTGYLYAWLASDYGHSLIHRHAYGSVILEIDADMLASVPVPFPSPSIQEEIGCLVIRANRLRHEAWEKEQAAIAQLEGLIQNSLS